MPLSKNLKVRLVASFLNRIASFAIVPFMMLFFVQTFGLKLAGLIGILQVVISYTSNLIGGYLGDTYDDRRLIFSSQIVQAITQLLIGGAVFLISNQWLTICLYFINLIVANLYKSTFSSLLIASVNEENKKKAYMYDYVSVNISLALGISIGSMLFGKYQYLVFILSALLIIIVAFILNNMFNYQNINPTTTNHFSSLKHEIIDLIRSYKIPLKDKRFVAYVLGSAFIMASPLAIETLGQVHFSDAFTPADLAIVHLHKGPQLFGLLQIENVITVVLSTFFLSAIINRLKVRTMIGMLLFYVMSYNIIYNSTSIPLILMLTFVGGIAELSYSSFVQAMQVELVPAAHRSKYISFNSLGNYISQLIGSTLLIVLSASNMLITTILLIGISLIGITIITKIGLSLQHHSQSKPS